MLRWLGTTAPAYFKDRREKLLAAHPDACFLFPANSEALRNPDVHHPYRQSSHFYYLTGFEEPDSFLVLGKESVLFLREREAEKELWDGERYGVERASSVFGFAETASIQNLEARLPHLLRPAGRIFYRLGLDEAMDHRVLSAIERLTRTSNRKTFPPIFDPGTLLGEMRLIKSSEEIAALRKAGEISANAHVRAMETVKPGMGEHEIAALLDYEMIRGGCARTSYLPIVAGGSNATCLHYRANNCGLKDGELLLIDAGGEYEYLAADITRTFPIGKKYTSEQAAIYDLVLFAQKSCIELARPGIGFHEIHARAVEVIADGLVSLGFLSGKTSDLLREGKHKKFFPHGTSHWLGMDVHDVGTYYDVDGASRKLEVGNVLTVEPGIYFQPNDTSVPKEYRGIGIRIEDDIVITAEGCEVLTSQVPKERADIEKLRSKA